MTRASAEELDNTERGYDKKMVPKVLITTLVETFALSLMNVELAVFFMYIMGISAIVILGKLCTLFK
jgi:hypothetical protein